MIIFWNSTYKEVDGKEQPAMALTDVWTDIISNKFEYINELNPKENPIIKYLSVIINCEFEFVDMDPDINGMKMEDITSSDIAPEFLLFLSII